MEPQSSKSSTRAKVRSKERDSSVAVVPRREHSGILPEDRDAILARLDSDPSNSSQSKAELHVHGPLLVLSGAGTGKTRVVTKRICRLIAEGVRPRRILATTFTNKAADEMEERIDRFLQNSVNARPKVTTLHSLGVSILKEHAQELNYSQTFQIVEGLEQDEFLEAGLRELSATDLKTLKGHKVDALREIISDFKGRLIHANQADGPYAKAYYRYQKELLRAGGIDLDDQIRLPVLLFEGLKNSEAILAEWQKKFSFILCDEYQDTDLSQYRLLKLLSAQHGNFCAVGDDDQSIYGWRGSQVGLIRNFEEDWKDAKVVKLEMNYRSTQPILDHANTLMQHEEGRQLKRLVAFREGGKLPKVIVHGTHVDEAHGIADRIKELCENGVPLGEMTVLVRGRKIAKPILKVLKKRGIDFEDRLKDQLHYGKVKRNLLALFHTIDDPRKSDMFLIRLLKMNRFNPGASEFEHILDFREQHKGVLWDMLDDVKDELRSSAKRKITNFQRFVSRFYERHESLMHDDALHKIVKDASLALYPKLEEIVTIEGKKEKRLDPWLQKQVDRLGEYEQRLKGCTIRQWMGNESRKKKLAKGQKDGDRVVVQSIHSSKGEEYQHVFLAGCEDRVIPSSQSLNSGDEARLAEERRLMFVAITRAKDGLYVSLCKERGFKKRKSDQLPSPFLEESGLDRLYEQSTGRNTGESQSMLFMP